MVTLITKADDVIDRLLMLRYYWIIGTFLTALGIFIALTMGSSEDRDRKRRMTILFVTFMAIGIVELVIAFAMDYYWMD